MRRLLRQTQTDLTDYFKVYKFESWQSAILTIEEKLKEIDREILRKVLQNSQREI